MRSWRIDAGNGNVFSIKDATQIPPYVYPSRNSDYLDRDEHDEGKWVLKKVHYVVYTTRWIVKKF